MRKLQPREKIILMTTITLVVVYGFNQWVIKPLCEGKQGFEDQVQLAQQRLQKSQGMIEQAKILEKDYQQLGDVLGSASSQGKDTSSMLAQLENAAKEAGIRISNMQPQKSVDKGLLVIFPVDLIIDGSWASITKFVYLVQASPGLLVIEEMNLEKYSDAASSLRGRLVLSRLKVK